MLAVVCGLRLPLPRVVEAEAVAVSVRDDEGSRNGASRAAKPLTGAGDGGAEGRRVATAEFIEAVELSSMAKAVTRCGRGGGEARAAAAGARRGDGGRGVRSAVGRLPVAEGQTATTMEHESSQIQCQFQLKPIKDLHLPTPCN